MILGEIARPFVVLGGEFARSVRRRGELVMAFQYVNTEPAMVIWSGMGHHRSGNESTAQIHTRKCLEF